SVVESVGSPIEFEIALSTIRSPLVVGCCDEEINSPPFDSIPSIGNGVSKKTKTGNLSPAARVGKRILLFSS
ncbi:unnamed protein product, partial [Rotaria sp. Silwood1]